MIELRNRIGNVVKIYGDIVEQEAIDQIAALADFEPYLNAKIRIMPDVHAGASCTIGYYDNYRRQSDSESCRG